MDWRITPANDRVSDPSLKRVAAGLRVVEAELQRVCARVADIHRAPDHDRRERQLLWGDEFRVLERRDGHAFGQSVKDGYCGWIKESALASPKTATHFVSARGSFGFAAPDIKEPRVVSLSFGSRLAVIDIQGRFAKTDEGLFIPSVHLRPDEEVFADPAAVAELFLGTPYLWGGNSDHGIDCSGLVHAALLACGIACPGDSDLQETALGTSVAEGDPVRRGDLFFWKGHVAMAMDSETLIHANAHSMSVALEGIDSAIARIKAAGDGPVTSRKRI